METEVVPAPVETPAPPVEAPPEQSVADHAAQFDPKRPEPAEPTNDAAPETAAPESPTRHRAQSQKASPADVPRINQLTKKLREAEAELAKYRSAPQPAPAPERPTQETAGDRRRTQPDAAQPSHAKEFEFDSFEAYLEKHPDSDPNTSYDRYRRAELQAFYAWQTAQSQQESKRTAAEQALTDAETALLTAHNTRMKAFIAVTPDYDEKFKAAAEYGSDVPPLLGRAIIEDDKGPQILYHLLTHPSLLDEMRLLTDGKAISESSVATLRRRLQSFVQAAPTESAAGPRFTHIAPRPPNSVRTGPLNTGPELPGDGASIAAHAKAFGPNRRR